MYKKLNATHFFYENQLRESVDKVLIFNEKDEFIEFVDIKEAGDDIQYFEGILSPGFVNAHCHLELSHMKGMIPAHTGLQEFVKQIVALRQVAPEVIQEAIVNAEAEMMANGIVAVGDISNTLDTLTQKAKHNLAYYSFVELYDLDPSRAADKIEAGLEIQKQFQENCVRASLVPHAPYSVTNDLWNLLSAHFGIHTISLHNQETPDENDFFKTKTGSFLGMYERTKVNLDFFEATGLSALQSVLPVFKKAHHGILVHNSFTSVEDIQAVHAAMDKAFWCLCPNANQYIEQTMPPVELLRSEKARLVIGTDSYASNWSLNILDELKTIQQYHPQIPLAEMLGWATINGAEALQMDKHLGSFEKGKQPGVVLITGVNAVNDLKNASSQRIL
jgi:cytosine/adenosine deaminase-related metal-dependent hydrolase